MTKSGNPYHVEAGSPKGGQFDFAPGRAEVAARKAAGLSSDPGQEKRFEAYEKFHLGTEVRAKGLGAEQLHYEMASIIGENGEFIKHEVGEDWDDGHGLKFTNDEIKSMDGYYVVHNHPNNSGISSVDLKFGAEHELKGIVATTPQGMWIVNFDREAIAYNPRYVGTVLKTVHQSLSGFIDVERMGQVSSGELTASEGILHRSKDIMKALMENKDSKDYIDYRFIPW